MFICDIFELWKTTPPSSGSHTRCTCWIWFPAHSPVKTTEVQTLPYAETKPCWLHLSYMKSKPKVHTQPHNITGPSLSIQLQVSYLEKHKIKIVRAFFFLHLFYYFDTQRCWPGQVPHNHRVGSQPWPSRCSAWSVWAVPAWREGIMQKWSYAKNVTSQHWHDNPAYTSALWFKGEAPYYAGETTHWLRKCQSKLTAKFFDALQWTIITALSRKVAQLTEINAWGIIVVKNTLLLMTFYRNFYSEGILNILNAGQREHCR